MKRQVVITVNVNVLIHFLMYPTHLGKTCFINMKIGIIQE